MGSEKKVPKQELLNYNAFYDKLLSQKDKSASKVSVNGDEISNGYIGCVCVWTSVSSVLGESCPEM